MSMAYIVRLVFLSFTGIVPANAFTLGGTIFETYDDVSEWYVGSCVVVMRLVGPG